MRPGLDRMGKGVAQIERRAPPLIPEVLFHKGLFHQKRPLNELFLCPFSGLEALKKRRVGQKRSLHDLRQPLPVNRRG